MCQATDTPRPPDHESDNVHAFIALGSNLDQPVKQLAQAVSALDGLPGTQVLRTSHMYANPPMGPQDQPDYVNAVALIATCLTPGALLEALKGLEQSAGRLSTRVWGARVLDLDILTYGDRVLNTPVLTIPHPGIAERRFVLAPWHEIAPDARLPDGRLIAELLLSAPEHPLHIVAPPTISQKRH
ncbi:2-amino-4-hydroxy-6-hydroxymethyldihydropteridine diphosphokinase [Halothiobacillus sp.]|uniref:2-amino-4-hydroxy-6- hydroxymethyldihydropteridine diphosphokinase n=1 Tax=Halothiobacillus sp. TaxID=1891311 RepID=UPI002620B3ED|nr:2-amino-4-hydroxy-6-hydroxymethyldihydropteridine diphosphokinase [Halothiobacillus sp.]MDD4966826.1 2-amino-4-hydroxy-6-hydroxymethyldihydropteridine diphosphokinase [Halothiobacillus sp.]